MAAARWMNRAAGLSPRVRGNPVGIDGLGRKAGSIPACAGEPAGYREITLGMTVYPRVCGGTTDSDTPGYDTFGLSPRVRGNQERDLFASRMRRSIPACAGEPAFGSPRLLPHGVYPRVCGGTSTATQLRSGVWGLSPRVRGNRDQTDLRLVHGGSIPACAGEPCRARRRQGGQRVYPRVCGGTRFGRTTAVLSMGLSPRVRGNRW